MEADVVLDVLERTRILYSSERDVHDAVEEALLAAGLVVSREVPLDAQSRIDLLVEDVGIECKVSGSWRTVARQLERYATYDQIGSLVLVTTQNRHTLVPVKAQSGKPIFVHRVGTVL